ncbi:hypothetical protein [Sphingomonas sp. S6]|jgi:hypothetical protein|uniref:hypothetical protein n=1 Tax=Sphingomonas sp. S6 TaxID=3368600 RepID=UPI000FA64FF9|nr:hypothetical protein [uncultured Sphingomonas sp.]RTL23458.1 MAG: hypothetical protein EKK50_00340 [Sphingomonadaceae bacterium]
MASIAHPARGRRDENSFFVRSALVMATITFIGFASNFVLGRVHASALPLHVHLHALLFATWMALYVAQTMLANRAAMRLHRRLGWAATALAAILVPLGIAVTLIAIRRHSVPFFFPVPVFLAINVFGLLGFSGLFAAAIMMRRRREWHPRLMVCAAAMLSAPAFGRLLPMPLLGNWGPLAITIAVLAYPVAGMVHDRNSRGGVHRAWWVGACVIAIVQLTAGPLAFSSAFQSISETIASG